MGDIYYIDGEFVKDSEAVISVNDMAVLRGFGIFDFLRTYGGKPFFLEDHIKRLENSGNMIGVHLPNTNHEIYDIVMETLKKNDHDEYNIRIVVTGGNSPDSITPQETSRLLVMITGLHPLPKEWYTDGVTVITSHLERYMHGAKSTTYMPAVQVLKNARAQSAIESIYVDRDKRVLEGTTSNFFAFINNKLVTADEGILPGITRQVLLEILKDEFEIEVRDIHIDELKTAEEAFITASNKEIVPVTKIDSLVLSNNMPGPKTKRIMEIFREYTDNYKNS